jgi:hypothetical protein
MIRDCSGPALSDDLQITREIDGRHTRRRGSRDYGGRRRGEEAALFAPSKVVEVGLGCTVSCETQRCEDQEEIECCKPNVLRIALARVERDGGGEKPVAVVLRGSSTRLCMKRSQSANAALPLDVWLSPPLTPCGGER